MDTTTAEENPMTSYTFLYPTMIVHRTGCADIQREANRSSDTTVVREAADIQTAIAEELVEGGLGELDYTATDYNVKPCAR